MRGDGVPDVTISSLTYYSNPTRIEPFNMPNVHFQEEKSMKARSFAILAAASIAFASAAFPGEPVKAAPLRQASFSKPPVATKTNGNTKIAFTLDAATDVEVAILDARGQVVRHLAAGVLGPGSSPPAPLKAGLSQELEWDGKDDYGQNVSGGPFKVRVRAGMGAKLERIVGGDPYAFFSMQSGNGDHFQWKVSGLEAKADGKVYVMGNTTFYGSQVIRQYDAAGNYIKTVFPPPSDKPLDVIEGWGVHVRDDGTFTMKNCSDGWHGTGLGTTGISSGRYGAIKARITPTADNDTLELLGTKGLFQARTDGALKSFEPQPFFGSAQLPPNGRLRGPCFTALSPDGKRLYVSGRHSFQRERSYGRIQSVDTSGFWRDGQLWEIDLATRQMSVFFALDEKTVPGDMETRAKVIGDMDYINPGAALHGVAVDPEGRVFVCDRLNRRVAVLDQNGKLICELPVEHPDAIGVSPKSRAVYVTTRHGDYGGGGKVQLLKFNDWSTGKAPASTVVVSGGVARYGHESLLTVVEHEGKVLVWVAYTMAPVRIYSDAGAGLELVKDFYESGIRQRALDLQHMQVDRQTGHVYIDAADAWCFRITDWQDPKFEVCMDAATKKRMHGANIAIDPRNRYLYTQAFYGRPARRYAIDGDRLVPAPVGDAGDEVTAEIIFGWGFNGLRPKGMAVCPDGSLVTLGNPRDSGRRADDYGGYIYYWKRDETEAPWKSTYLGRQSSGGIRFDPSGNMYISVGDDKPRDLPEGYGGERRFFARIHKFAPTGSLKDGCLYPTAPAESAKIYDVRCSPIAHGHKNPRFGVDEYGRTYYASGIEARVGVIDNEGNRILWFGTYGNRDSMGGLQRDKVPTNDVPMAWPSSVDATDDYIYVTDIVNIRLLRLAKTFAAAETIEIK